MANLRNRFSSFAFVASMLVGTSCMPSPTRSGTAPTEPRSQPIPADLRQDVQTAQAIGRQLYVFDKVAWIATDVLAEQIGDITGEKLGGYLPVRELASDGRTTDIFATYFYTRETPARVRYVVHIVPDMKPTFTAFDPPREMPPAIAALAKARQVAIGALPTNEQPRNPVVLPGLLVGKPGVLVYLLAGTRKPNVVVLGKHYRAIVPIGGEEVSEMKPLSNGILELSTKGPRGEKVEALVVTHVLDDVPIETHVFASLQSKLPLLVGTRRGAWLVEGDHVEYLGELPKKSTEVAGTLPRTPSTL